MMVASEFGAFMQRVIISTTDVTDAAKSMKAGAAEVVVVPGNAEPEGQDTEVKQFEATKLENYIKAIDHVALTIALRAHLPKHYLLQQGDVSGEALIAMEAALTKDAGAYQARLDVTWKSLAAFVMGLSGHSVKAKDIECVWEDEHTVQPYTEALIVQTYAKAGMPLPAILRHVGWPEEKIAEFMKDLEAEEKRAATMGAAALAEARMKFDRGEGDTEPYPAPPQPKGKQPPPPPSAKRTGA